MRPSQAPKSLRASNLPSDLKDAFIDALDAWTHVEHQLFMLFQFLGDTREIDSAWASFCELKSLSRQCVATAELARARIPDEALLNELIRIVDRLRKLARKRNALVHGRWIAVEIIDGSNRLIDTEYLRRYDPPDAGSARPKNQLEDDQQREKTRFSTQDMNRSGDHFRKLGRDMLFLMESLAKGYSQFRPMP